MRELRWIRVLGLVASLLLASVPARAADAATDAIQAAYAPYRAALVRTNAKAQAESERAIGDAIAAWRGVVERFGTAAPPPYDRDARFAATLAEVASIYDEAQRRARTGDLTGAHEVLERVRDLLADLRQRNGVVVFSDAMNAYHAEMEHAIAEGPRLLDEPQGTLKLMARVGTLEYLAARLRTQAPAALQADADFAAAQRAVAESVAALRAAVLAGDRAAIDRALAALKGPYGRMFLRFG
ncbi:hypothetical protein [Azohydromonas sediminis]|uniref:hypothetical protein n=1 Tax=Azohydromonas sediminis TaxID=2259674 RepID=UPI000E65B5D1|nr:hypothetical protein [Azohydromonas sediminis]